MQIISFKGSTQQTQHTQEAQPKVDHAKEQHAANHPIFSGIKGREPLTSDVFTPRKPSK